MFNQVLWLYFFCMFILFYIFLFKKGKNTLKRASFKCFLKKTYIYVIKNTKKMAESKILIGRKLIFKPVLYHFWKLMSWIELRWYQNRVFMLAHVGCIWLLFIFVCLKVHVSSLFIENIVFVHGFGGWMSLKDAVFNHFLSK